VIQTITFLGDYRFQVESLPEVIEELKPMFAENHSETGIYDMPFNPDYDRFLDLAKANGLEFMTIRLEEKVVGYALFFIDYQIYQKDVLTAVQSLTYIDPGHRGIGYKFIKFCDDILEAFGIDSVWRQASEKKDISPIYKRLGYRLVEKTYLKEF